MVVTLRRPDDSSIAYALLRVSLGLNRVAPNERERTAGMQVYSNVFIHEETATFWDMSWRSNVVPIQEQMLYFTSMKAGTATQECLCQARFQTIVSAFKALGSSAWALSDCFLNS